MARAFRVVNLVNQLSSFAGYMSIEKALYNPENIGDVVLNKLFYVMFSQYHLKCIKNNAHYHIHIN